MTELEGAREDQVLLVLVVLVLGVGGIAACPVVPRSASSGSGDGCRHFGLGADCDRPAPVFVLLCGEARDVHQQRDSASATRTTHGTHAAHGTHLHRTGKDEEIVEEEDDVDLLPLILYIPAQQLGLPYEDPPRVNQALLRVGGAEKK